MNKRWPSQIKTYLQHPCNWKLLNAIRSYDEELFIHAVESAYLVELVARQLKLHPAEKKLAIHAALLHDVGKITWPHELKTKYPLDEKEKKLILIHPVTGVKIVQKIWPEAPDLLLRIILEHHERPSGNGYPFKMARDKIHYLSQIVAACESFSAMINERPYRANPLNIDEALHIQRQQLFDTQIISAITRLIPNHRARSMTQRG